MLVNVNRLSKWIELSMFFILFTKSTFYEDVCVLSRIYPFTVHYDVSVFTM